jgi:membrane-associated phospholipid phosphatase
MESILNFDALLFDLINQGMSNAFFDMVLPYFREKLFWAPLYIFIISVIILNFSTKKALILLLGIAFSVAIADFTSSKLIKKNVQRIRPCNDEFFSQHIIKRVPCGSGFSFTSSHACNHFAVAIFLIGIFGRERRWIRPALLLWAFLIAFSQVYVGVHYPFDVIVGGIIGSLIGISILSFQSYLTKFLTPKY